MTRMPPRPRPAARLSLTEVEAFVRSHPGWRLEQGELRRTYEFRSFAESMRFVNEIAEMAERENHHPDFDVRYKRVTVALLTYDADGITAHDTAMAEQLDALKLRLAQA